MLDGVAEAGREAGERKLARSCQEQTKVKEEDGRCLGAPLACV